MRFLLSAVLLLLPALALGADEAAFLAAGRATLASEIEAGLPERPVAAWLAELAGRGDPLREEVHDCGEQSGRPEPNVDLPVCVEFRTAAAPEAGEVFLYFQVGSVRSGVVEARALRLAGIVQGERVRLFGTLAELAVESRLEQWGSRRLSEYGRDELVRLAGAVPATVRTRAAFESLEAGLSMIEMVRLVGLPDADTGSGVHLFRYALVDGSAVTVWCTGLDQPASVRVAAPTY